MIEQVILLISIARSKSKDNSYLFSYDKLLKSDPEHFLRVFSILGIEGELARDKFEKNIFNRRFIESMKKVIITGVTGQDGSFMAD